MRRSQRARRHEIGVVGQGKHATGGHGDIFREAAVAVLAHDPHVFAKRLVAREAVAAFAAEGFGVERRLHSRLQPAARLRLGDHARRVDAHHLRQRVRDARAVVAHIEIDAVQRTRDDAQDRFALGPHRIGKVAPTHAVLAAPLQNRRLHAFLPDLSRDRGDLRSV